MNMAVRHKRCGDNSLFVTASKLSEKLVIKGRRLSLLCSQSVIIYLFA